MPGRSCGNTHFNVRIQRIQRAIRIRANSYRLDFGKETAHQAVGVIDSFNVTPRT